ncbi:hypothetical protein BHM03_00047797 [Ensete ventricosum]|nr:hypothetical protein BHM03_00047797 [Ensete ventricosum]
MTIDFDSHVSLAEKNGAGMAKRRSSTGHAQCCGWKGAASYRKHWWWFPTVGSVTEQIAEVTTMRGRSGKRSTGSDE